MAGGKCNNCGAVLSCGCQKTTASNGRSCCNNCINQYERSIGNYPKSENKKFVWEIGKRR